MAGHQFSFFLGPSDQSLFEKSILNQGDATFIRARPSSNISEVLDTSILSEFGKDPLRILIVMKLDLSSIKFTPIKGGIGFTCDPISQPIIEFDRPFIGNNYIRSGRLYQIDSYFGQHGELVNKSKEFIEWSRRLFAVTKAGLTPIQRGLYAGREALAMRGNGIAFEGLDKN